MIRTILICGILVGSFTCCQKLVAQSSVDSITIFELIDEIQADQLGGLRLAQCLDSLAQWESNIDHVEWRATILCALTEKYTGQAEYDQATFFSDRNLDLIRLHGSELTDSVMDLIYFLNAALLIDQAMWEEGERYLDTSYQILARSVSPTHIRKARNAIRMSYLTYNQGNVTKTIEWTQEGIDQMLKVNQMSSADSTQMASLYNNIAFLNNASGRFDDVIPNYNFALQFDPTLVSPYINQAVLLRTTQPMQSIALSEKALTLIPRSTYHNRSNCFSNIVAANLVLAEALEDSTHFHQALAYHDSILAMTPYANDRDYPFAANTHGLFADYFSRVAKKRDLEKASYHLEQQINHIQNFYSNSNTSGLKNLMFSPKERLARLSVMKGDFRQAEQALREVHAGYHSESPLYDDEFVFNSKLLLSNSYYVDYPLTHLSNLITWSTTIDDPMEKLIEADHIYRVVDTTYDELLSKNELDIERLHFDRLHARGTAAAILAYEATKEDRHLVDAYSRIEKLFTLDLFKNRIQAKLKNSTDAHSKLYRERLMLREEIDLLNRSGTDDEEELHLLDSLNQRYVALMGELGTQYQPDRMQTFKNPTLLGLQSRLTPDEAVLYYVHDKASAAVYGLCITSIEINPIRSEVSDLEHLIYSTNKALSDPASTNYKTLLQQLYEIFINPIADQIIDKNLTICSMGKLELAPYDLLLNSEGDYLCFNHPIRHLYSASFQSDSSLAKAGRIFGYTASPKTVNASIVRDGQVLQDLQAGREEINYLTESFNAKVFIDEESTKDAFLQSAGNAGIIHLSMHGVLNILEPIRSRIVFDLNGDETKDLHYHEIDDLELNAQLVTLSACNSGIGTVQGAGSIASLARAFNYAGCPNVIQTLWSINDESSLVVMKAFYEELGEGTKIAQALSSAKRKFYDSAPNKWQHPYYWGGYIFNGQDVAIQIDAKSESIPFSIPGIALTLLLIAGLVASVYFRAQSF